jgi:site-specific recombinase XerD
MGEITLKKALDDYRTIHMPYRNFADRTREEYLNDLQDFVRFLEQSGINHPKAIGLPIVERYAAHLEYQGLASRTRKRKVVSIRSFLSFLYQESYIATNIADKVILPFTESTLPFVLTQTECDQLRNACADSRRDSAIIELLLQTGIKLSQLIDLTLNDVEFDETEKTGDKQKGFMRITSSRGKKERLIPLNTKACIALKDYLEIRGDTESDNLFLNRFGKLLGERGVEKMLKKYLKKAGVGRATIQTLRHTFGAQHIAKGTALKTIQEVMGLKDTRSTSIYQTLAKEIVTRELQENSI